MLPLKYVNILSKDSTSLIASSI